MMALKVSGEDLKSIYTVIKHHLETNYLYFWCSVRFTEMRGKSQEKTRMVDRGQDQ